jgi:hypothetical protein
MEFIVMLVEPYLGGSICYISLEIKKRKAMMIGAMN